MKKKIIFSSALSIVLCLTLICGATFALFTDSDQVDIAVTSGKVDIEVTVENIQTISREQDKWDDDKLFTNGGKVEFAEDSNKLTIDRITPGDAVRFDLVVTNSSNVAIQFFTKLGLVDGVKLFQGMDMYINNEATAHDGITRVSAWQKLEGITDGSTKEIARIPVVIELPYLSTPQNDLQDLSTTMYFTVQAVQGNADPADMEAVKNGVTHLYTALDLQLFAENVSNGNSYKDETVVLMNDVDLGNMAWTPIGAAKGVNEFKGTFDGQGYTISNLNVQKSEYAGLFGAVRTGAVIKNVKVQNATIKTNHYAGAIVAWGYGTITGCSVDNATIVSTPEWIASKGAYDNGDKAGVLAGWFSAGQQSDYVTNNTVTNSTVTAYRDAGALIGHLADEAAGNFTTVEGNTIKNVAVTLDPTHAYAANTSANAGKVAGRFANPAKHTDIESVNTIENVTVDVMHIDFTVGDDASLAAAITAINTNSKYWNTAEPVVVKLAANTYTGNYMYANNKLALMQYPDWDGIVSVSGGPTSNIAILTNSTNYTNVVFVGEEGVVLAGNFSVVGNGYSGDAMQAPRNATTTFKDITFDAANSADEENDEDAIAMYVKAAASNVTFENCVFQNATHVTVGDGGTGAAGTITFDTCDFPDGASLSGGFYALNVKNCTVATKAEKFEDAFVNCNRGTAVITVDNCVVNCAKYAFRTMSSSASAQTIIVTNSTINVHEAEGKNYLVYFRGGNTETATFTNCSLSYGTLKTGNGTVTIGYTDENGNPLTMVSDGFYKNAAGDAYYVYNAAGLQSLKNWMDSKKSNAFWGKTYNIMADIDASSVIWETQHLTPDSSYANGITFNGNGHTISNLTITGQGLFTGATKGGNSTVPSSFNDITFDNATVTGGSHHNGVIWGEAYDSLTLNKVSVMNSKVSGGCNVGALVGRNSECHAVFTFVDCAVKNTTVEATKQADNAGASAFLGMALHIGTSCSANVVFEGTNVAEGNTLISAGSMQGGGIYTCATWGNATWDTPTVVNDFTNYNSNN